LNAGRSRTLARSTHEATKAHHLLLIYRILLVYSHNKVLYCYRKKLNVVETQVETARSQIATALVSKRSEGENNQGFRLNQVDRTEMLTKNDDVIAV
jgi:hypothetical protein